MGILKVLDSHSHLMRCLPVAILALSVQWAAASPSAIAERRLSVVSGDIPGRNPDCSIVSIDRLNATRMAREILALEKGMSPEQVDAIVTGDPTERYGAIAQTEFGVMRWKAVTASHEIELLLGFKHQRLQEIDLIVRSGDTKCVIGVDR